MKKWLKDWRLWFVLLLVVCVIVLLIVNEHCREQRCDVRPKGRVTAIGGFVMVPVSPVYGPVSDWQDHALRRAGCSRLMAC